ncbi:hypothetical protein GCM10020358_49170 [Amorphoplanes nipponensis]|uniref:Uncharacterized protein n=1 Tax=Actinoplanes nipponensis TaxID=135950 RepID=A0A919JLT6_9ACTN|nr:hypothetical protein [Actinoplanes nipponensis]GIE53158.1 hypothetical protein Ani05nite_66920 [Actinoplanes nipponensis]
MSHHELTPKSRYVEYQIVVGWDRPLGSYFAQVINHNTEPIAGPTARAIRAVICRVAAILHLPNRWRPAEPVFIWLGADRVAILEPAEVIDAVAPYAVIPPDLENTLARDRRREGSRHYRP